MSLAHKKYLIVCEKPSVAANIAQALNVTKKEKNWLEGEDVYITWCRGHLLTAADPEAYKPAWAKWDIKNLPMIPPGFKFKYVPKDNFAEYRLKTINMLASKVDMIINACDAGREGELIFKHVIDFCQIKNPAERMWLNTSTNSGIVQAWKSRSSCLLPKYKNLAEAALIRSQADWILGINGTQAATLMLPKKQQVQSGTHAGVWSIGRVQTALLGLVVDRDERIRTFKPQPYYSLYLNFADGANTYEARLLTPEDMKSLGHFTMLFAEESEIRKMEYLIRSEVRINPWSIEEKREDHGHSPPKLFDLLDLQRVCNRLYGWTASYTLSIAQKAYEVYKIISYPRTDSKALPEDTLTDADNLYTKLWDKLVVLNEGLKTLAQVLPSKSSTKHNIFNNEKVTDHFAIIPTEEIPDISRLLRSTDKIDVDVVNLWLLIAKRFILAFAPPAKSKSLERISNIDIIISNDIYDWAAGDQLTLSALTKTECLIESGWYTYADVLDQDLPNDIPDTIPLPEPVEVAVCRNIECYHSQTTSPEPYTEELILGVMETNNLGTPSTRASMIDTLVDRKYIIRSLGKPTVLKATVDGQFLTQQLREHKLDYLTQPFLTAAWEDELELIEKGKKNAMSRELFLEHISYRAREIVRNLETVRQQIDDKFLVLCPKTLKPAVEKEKGYLFPGFPKLLCPKELAKRHMEMYEYRDILTSPRGAGPYDGFMSKEGRPFKARVVFDIKTQQFLFKFK